jgi:glycosyltransferase involved in cell wall biosynthesis
MCKVAGVDAAGRRRWRTRAILPVVRAVLPVLLAACVGVASLRYVLQTATGTRPLQPLAPDSWGFCVTRLDELEDPALAPVVWQKSARGADNLEDENQPLTIDESARKDIFTCKCQQPPVYDGPQPTLTAIVQSFNHRTNIANISGALKASTAVEEIVICEDGSTDGSVTEWHRALPGPSHFIIRSNNLHELRSYNRAMRMSAGDVVVLLQDDDLLPLNDEWLHLALRLFESKPDLGILGGYIGQLWDPDSGTGYEFGEQRSTHGGLREGRTQPIPFLDPLTGVPFMYAECVWIAPVFARRSLLQKIGGLELTLAKRGEPGVWQDCVFSYEAWVNGFTVGLFSAKFERGVGGHGSASDSRKVKQRARVWERAVSYTNRKYYRKRVHEYVENLNNRTLNQRTQVMTL